MEPLRIDNAVHRSRLITAGICVFLAAMVWVVYGQTLGFGFVNYDDNVYIYENPEVRNGITARGIAWALTYAEIGHWHPVTWLSHMLDCQVYGLQAWGHHLTNVLLHGTAAILLFLVLRRMTGALWRSAFVAAVFAVHPLHVESVAWIAERKDVLSAVFFMLTLWAYARYAQGPRSWGRYFVVVALFAIGLMCKGMLVTLPFVLLLLDYWPLHRLKLETPDGKPVPWQETRACVSRLAIEKIPLFALSAASCVITILAPEQAAGPGGQLGILARLENAAVSCVIYLRQMVWPARLAIPYPYPLHGWQAYEVAVALALLIGISIPAAIFWRKRPYLIAGWLWYLGMLAPVSGIVQISYYAHADRYTYLPQIGLYIAVTWLAVEIWTSLHYQRLLLGGIAGVVLATLAVCAHIQVSCWKNSLSLWTHAISRDENNYFAYCNLGSTLMETGQLDESIEKLLRALEIKPDFADAYYSLGYAYQKKGEIDKAIAQYRKALEFAPDMLEADVNLGVALQQKGEMKEAAAYLQKARAIKSGFAEIHNNLGLGLLRAGDTGGAIAHLQKAIEIEPDYAEGHNNLGLALLQKGAMIEAIAQFQKAIEIKPDYADPHYNLGLVFQQGGLVDEAIAQYQQALAIIPADAASLNFLGYALLQERNVDGAIIELQKAIETKPGYAEAHYNLGLAFLQKGKAQEAIARFQKAIEIKPDYAEAHYDLGLAFQQSGEVDKAIAQYLKALEIKPGLLEPRLNLGIAYRQKGEMNEALAQFRNAVETNPGSAKAHNDLGLAYLQSGKVAEAIGHFQRALEIEPGYGEARSNLDLALRQKADK